MSRVVDAVVVAIPAHDEQTLLPACLASVARAEARLRADRPGCEVAVVLAADSCTDGTAALARACGVHVVELQARCVGLARDAAIEAGLGLLGLPSERVWIANTDADTVVPADWLTNQLAVAEQADVLLGTVEPDPADADAGLLQSWFDQHHLADGHPYVFGANLGLSAEVWRTLDGFGPRPVHEDVELAERARQRFRVLASDRFRVSTSARTSNRVPGGFGGYIAALG